MDALINILDLCETGTMELGPGYRFVIWVQGCPFNCKGCASPEGIPITLNKMMSIEEIACAICSNKEITGITISGGEPFMQASKLVGLLDMVKAARPDLDIIVFSGFRLEELVWPEAEALLCRIDVLIDGLYVAKLNDNRGLRGSSNQRIHHITPRWKAHHHYFEEKERNVEVHVYKDFQVIIGVPNKDVVL